MPPGPPAEAPVTGRPPIPPPLIAPGGALAPPSALQPVSAATRTTAWVGEDRTAARQRPRRVLAMPLVCRVVVVFVTQLWPWTRRSCECGRVFVTRRPPLRQIAG